MQVTHNQEKHRFEYESAFIDYREGSAALRILHTEVPDGMEGRGIGGALVRATLDYARSKSLKVVPLCSFASAWLDRHAEYHDLL